MINKKRLFLPALLLPLSLTFGCASKSVEADKPAIVVDRQVSSSSDKIMLTIPANRTVLFICADDYVSNRTYTVYYIISDSRMDDFAPGSFDGTSRVIESLRKTRNYKFEVLSGRGVESLSYQGRIESDAHKGSNLFMAEDIDQPRGSWISKSYKLSWHPDISYLNRSNGLEYSKEQAELLVGAGAKALRCSLHSQFRPPGQ